MKRLYTLLILLSAVSNSVFAQCNVTFQYSVNNNTVSFYATGTNGTINPSAYYAWDFGDGSSGTGIQVSHQYTSGLNNYLVCVTYADSNGCTSTFCDTVILNNSNPNPCNTTVSYTYTSGANTPSGGYVFQSQISGFGTQVQYYWYDQTGNISSTQANPTFYLQPGTYTICLNVMDGVCSDTFCSTITITNSNPNPCNTSVSYTYSPNSSGTGNYTFQSQISGFGNNPTYLWQDLSGITYSTQANPTIYLQPGTHTICLYVYDSICIDTFCNTITVSNTNPCNTSVSYTYTSGTNIPGGGYAFQSQISGFGSQVQYYWYDQTGNISSTQANPTFYLQPGTYNICLYVSDGVCSDTFCNTITITNTNPCNTTVNFTYSATAGTLNSYYFQSQISGFSSNAYYTWIDANGNVLSNQQNVILSFQPGTYTICLIVDDSICVDSICNTITVTNSNPCNTSVNFTFNNSPNSTGSYNFQSQISGFGSTVQYIWYSTNSNIYSTQANPSFNLLAGTYNICLYVTDGICSDTFCNTITISNSNPTPCNTSVSYTYSGATGAFGAYYFQSQVVGFGPNPFYSWIDGNGNILSNQQNPILNLTPGSYSICLVVQDSFCVDTFCNNIVIQGSSPCSNLINSFSYHITPSGVGVFMVNNNPNSTGNNNGITYQWSFGNGSSIFGTVVTYVFGTNIGSTSNNYFACLIATDSTGCSDTLCTSITIPVVPVVNPVTPPFVTVNGNNSNIPGNNWVAQQNIDDNSFRFNDRFSENLTNIFPNPFSEILNIQFMDGEQVDRITIYNELGQCIFVVDSPSDALNSINLSDVPDGIYILHLEKGAEFINHKIIKREH